MHVGVETSPSGSVPLSLHVSLAQEPGAFTRLHDEWRLLLARATRPTAFQTIEWLSTWHRIISGTGQLWVLVARDLSGEMVGVVPLEMRHYGIGPLSLRVLSWLGHRHGRGISVLTDTLGPITNAGQESRVLSAALEYLRQHDADWDVLELTRTPSTIAPDLITWARAAGYRPATYDPLEWPFIRLPSNWSALEQTLSRNLRNNLARCHNRLRREGHRELSAVLTEPTEIEAGLQRLFMLHRLRAQAAELKRHFDYFATPISRDFTIEVARRLSAQGRLALAQMQVDDTVVAAQLILIEGSTMSLHISGFDPAWKSYNVLTLLTQQCVQYAFGRGVRWIDLTTGGISQTKRQWATEVLQCENVQIARPALTSLLAARAYRELYLVRRRSYI